jgi:hypothetical protein
MSGPLSGTSSRAPERGEEASVRRDDALDRRGVGIDRRQRRAAGEAPRADGRATGEQGGGASSEFTAIEEHPHFLIVIPAKAGTPLF